MQLASSLFGILVVQVKPQLEAVLNLPAGALTKEIELSSQLMDFLQTYSVPTDVLSFDGDALSLSSLAFDDESVDDDASLGNDGGSVCTARGWPALRGLRRVGGRLDHLLLAEIGSRRRRAAAEEERADRRRRRRLGARTRQAAQRRTS